MTRRDHYLPPDDATAVVDAVDSEDGHEARSMVSSARASGVPTSVGRYLILEQVGQGGMSTVHSAFDPELERTVAIKLLYAARSQERLRREAMAIARVAHPNVISVYDVGYFEAHGRSGVFMVMELVNGVELDAWLSERERSWREIVGVFAQAGRGLEAAHGEGVIHRDFKPANVLVNSRGRPLVLDFGLARGVGSELGDTDEDIEPLDSREPGEIEALQAALASSSGSGSGSESGSLSGSVSRLGFVSGSGSVSVSRLGSVSGSICGSSVGRSSLLSAQLTRAGAIMGTPRYMSPEQHDTSAVDARSDQYSFCLSLYAALYGKQPFSSAEREGVRAVIKAKRAGVVDWDNPKVPEHIQAVLRRGMAPKPEDRWPDMGSLVDALEDDPSLRRRRWLLGGVGVLAVAASVAAAVAWDAHAEGRCEDQREWIAEAWGKQQQEAVETAFLAVDRPYSASALEHANIELDAYAKQLGEARAQLCLSEHRGDLEPAIVTARQACLDERHQQFRAVIGRLAQADAAVVEHTVDVLSALASVGFCTEISEFEVAQSDPEVRHAIERDLFEARLSAIEGRKQDGLGLFEEVLERARELDDPHTLILVLTRGGELYAGARQLDRAEELASEALLLAEQYDEHDLAIDALTCLAKVLSDLRGRWDDAQRTLDIARAKYAREPGGTRTAWFFPYLQASIHMQHHRFEEALAAHQAATEAVRETGSAMDIARALHAQGRVELEVGQVDEAEAHIQESIEIRTKLYGTDHPNLMYPYRVLAMVAAERGDFNSALEHIDHVIALGVRHHGPDAANLYEPHNERAKYLRRLGRYEEALLEYDEVLRLRRINGTTTSEELRLQSQVQLRLGRPELALELAEQALAEHREKYGADEQVPWLRARFIMHRGEALLALGRLDEALIDFERGAELRAAEKQDDLMIRLWTGEGNCRLALGDLAGAREAFERALAHREAGHDDDERTDGMLDFGLAKVAEDPETRRKWAELAIAAFEGHGGDDDLADEVRAWLAASSGGD